MPLNSSAVVPSHYKVMMHPSCRITFSCSRCELLCDVQVSSDNQMKPLIDTIISASTLKHTQHCIYDIWAAYTTGGPDRTVVLSFQAKHSFSERLLFPEALSAIKGYFLFLILAASVQIRACVLHKNTLRHLCSTKPKHLLTCTKKLNRTSQASGI